MKTVWIIGGLGPETTAEFYLELIFSCKKKNDEKKPAIVISNVPLPYNIEEDLILKNFWVERYLPFLIKEAKRLEKAGVDFIVIPCNSVHIFIDEIRKSVSIPILSIVEETIRFFKEKQFQKVWLISTSSTLEHKVYDRLLEKNNIDFIAPNDFEQALIWKLILGLISWRQSNRDRNELMKIISNFENKHVDCVALACTDLQLLIPSSDTLEVFDTMKIFVDATVREMLK